MGFIVSSHVMQSQLRVIHFFSLTQLSLSLPSTPQSINQSTLQRLKIKKQQLSQPARPTISGCRKIKLRPPSPVGRNLCYKLLRREEVGAGETPSSARRSLRGESFSDVAASVVCPFDPRRKRSRHHLDRRFFADKRCAVMYVVVVLLRCSVVTLARWEMLFVEMK